MARMNKAGATLVSAWVLWQELTFDNDRNPSWKYQDAFEDRPKCEAAIEPRIELAARSPNVVQKVIRRYKDSLRFINQDGYELILRYICTPDSVDPRPRLILATCRMLHYS
jgi:hypothetical protein